MPNKMLIDATHPEETRVVVLRGNRVEEFDFESANRKQLRGNIYLAKVTRVEPSLQAAFVDYGGNRHGFLAFSEIHPDYYQIPVADRQALIAEEERAQRAADAEAERRAGAAARPRRGRRSRRRRDAIKSEPVESGRASRKSARWRRRSRATDAAKRDLPEPEATDTPSATATRGAAGRACRRCAAHGGRGAGRARRLRSGRRSSTSPDRRARRSAGREPTSRPRRRRRIGRAARRPAASAEPEAGTRSRKDKATSPRSTATAPSDEEESIESVGGADAMEEVPERMPRLRRQYKIQEVIKRRQVMLVQVVKEERGTKGAALTTYLSLAGRYSVLMPNTARGGGISRKITSAEDRRRLKEIAQDLEVPEGMGVILRTAGASRTKTEVKRDFEYLLRLWETVRDLTLQIDRADAGLRGRLAGQALDPRPLQQGHRRGHRRRRGRPTRTPRTSCACSCRAMPRT